MHTIVSTTIVVDKIVCAVVVWREIERGITPDSTGHNVVPTAGAVEEEQPRLARRVCALDDTHTRSHRAHDGIHVDQCDTITTKHTRVCTHSGAKQI